MSTKIFSYSKSKHKKCNFLLCKGIGAQVNTVVPLTNTQEDVKHTSVMVITSINYF